MLGAGGIRTLEAIEHAGHVLAAVVEPGQRGCVLDRHVRVFRTSPLGDTDQVLESLNLGRIVPGNGIIDLAGQLVTLGPPRIAGHHYEITLGHALIGDLEVMTRMVGHVVLGIRRRFAVRANVGAIKGEITGLARPLPVVGITTELADRCRRRVGNAHIANLELAEQAVLNPAKVRKHPAAVAILGFALGHQTLLGGFDGIVAGPIRGLARNVAQHLGRHIGDVLSHPDARARPGRRFICQAGGNETIAQHVVFRGGIELQRTIGAMVVGDHQAVGRYERGGATAQ